MALAEEWRINEVLPEYAVVGIRARKVSLLVMVEAGYGA